MLQYARLSYLRTSSISTSRELTAKIVINRHYFELYREATPGWVIINETISQTPSRRRPDRLRTSLKFNGRARNEQNSNLFFFLFRTPFQTLVIIIIIIDIEFFFFSPTCPPRDRTYWHVVPITVYRDPYARPRRDRRFYFFSELIQTVRTPDVVDSTVWNARAFLRFYSCKNDKKDPATMPY